MRNTDLLDTLLTATQAAELNAGSAARDNYVALYGFVATAATRSAKTLEVEGPSLVAVCDRNETDAVILPSTVTDRLWRLATQTGHKFSTAAPGPVLLKLRFAPVGAIDDGRKAQVLGHIYCEVARAVSDARAAYEAAGRSVSGANNQFWDGIIAGLQNY